MRSCQWVESFNSERWERHHPSNMTEQEAQAQIECLSWGHSASQLTGLLPVNPGLFLSSPGPLPLKRRPAPLTTSCFLQQANVDLRALKPKGTIATPRLYHSALGTQVTVLEVLILLLNVLFVHAYWVEYSIKRMWLHSSVQFSRSVTPVFWVLANLFLSVPWKVESRGWHRVEIKLCCLPQHAIPTALLVGLCPQEMGCTGEVWKQHVGAWWIPYPIFSTEKPVPTSSESSGSLFTSASYPFWAQLIGLPWARPPSPCPAFLEWRFGLNGLLFSDCSPELSNLG